MSIVITESVARKVLDTVDAGLVKGVGNPKAGQMCVEAAVCFALDLPHGDDPQCVSRALRALKISLNDRSWSSNAARAKGLRRLAVVQLGSRDHIDDCEFSKRTAELAIRTCVPTALRAAALINKNPAIVKSLRYAADKCERKGTRESALEAHKAATYAADAADAATYATYAATYAANAAAAAATYADAARDKVLSDFAEGVVQILIVMKAPGCDWLPLTEIMS